MILLQDKQLAQKYGETVPMSGCRILRSSFIPLKGQETKLLELGRLKVQAGYTVF